MSAIVGLVLITLSCSGPEPKQDLVSYGYRLPDYCDNDPEKLQELEREAKRYGQRLTEMGYLGRWDGLLVALMQHYLLWGDFPSAVRVGDEYSRREDIAGFLEYGIAKFLVENSRDSGQGFVRWLEQTSFANAFRWDADSIGDRRSLGFDRIRDVREFQNWANDANGLEAVWILAARLQKLDSKDEALRRAVVETLTPFLTRGEYLDRFFVLTNQLGSWPWDIWLNSSLLLERYAVQEKMGLAGELRFARRSVAERMLAAGRRLGWVDCVLDESGVFAPTQLGLAQAKTNEGTAFEAGASVRQKHVR